MFNEGIAIIKHPPFITIFMGGINHRKWVFSFCYTHITALARQGGRYGATTLGAVERGQVMSGKRT